MIEVLGVIVAFVALAATAIAGYYTWSSFRIQKISSDPEGLLFIIRNIHRKIRIESSKPDQIAHATRSHLIVGFEARGPGDRYNVSLATWGEVDARFIPDMLPKWNSEGEILALEMHVKKGATELPQGVCVGIVWEVPSIFRKRFKSCGYRVRLKEERSSTKEDSIEVWSSKKNQWVKFKSGPSNYGHDALTAAASFQSRNYFEMLGAEFYSHGWDE